MNPDKPSHPTADLLAYWLDELDAAAAATVEEHLFECAHCSAQLGEIVRVGDALRAELLGGNVSSVVSAAFIRRMQNAGLRIREYQLQPGNSVNCTVAPDDDLVVSHLHALLGDVRQLDLVFDNLDGSPQFRARHIPFDANSGEVTLIPPVTALRSLGHARQRMQLVAIENATERVLGEYFFNHSPPGA